MIKKKATNPQNRMLTEKEKKLAAGILAGKGAQKAAMEAGYSPNNPAAASASASRALKKVNVRAYIDSLSNEAIEGILGIARDKKVSAKTRLSAYQDIADRGLGKATQAMDVTTGGKPLIRID